MVESRSFPILLTVKEVSALLQCSESTVWRHNGRKGFPLGRHYGGNVKWNAQEVAAYALSGRS